MANTLNASTSAGLVQTADTSGTIDLQSAGATKLTVSSSGTSIAQYNPAASLITSGTAVASTSGTSIDFTSIPSWVKRITVSFSSVSTNGSSDWGIQLGTSGGIVTSGYSGSTGNAVGGFQAQTTYAQTVYTATASTSASGSVTICLINSSTNLWAISGNGCSTTTYASLSGYSVTLSGALTTVRIKTGNGTDTFDAGSINILYE
jgi:hypothetical protein